MWPPIVSKRRVFFGASTNQCKVPSVQPILILILITTITIIIICINIISMSISISISSPWSALVSLALRCCAFRLSA